MVAGDQYRQNKFPQRISGIAMLDTVLTMGAAGLITKYKYPQATPANYIMVFIILILIGILAHVAVGQKTMLNYRLGLSQPPDIMKSTVQV